eukprot:GEMP01020171.1.p1 GENE.GEMP01020171.1~~GEMP01020171.1.p1  ORF type:complete len:243 (-),score=31.07 GEMP01020171.1:1714-2442(-)
MAGESQPLLASGNEENHDYCDQMDQVVRNGFIRKVYSILSIQLITTVLVALPFNMVPAVQEFVGRQPALLYLIIALNITFLIVLTCCPNMARKHPTNYALLAGFTLTESVLIGVITSMYKTSVVMLAVGITAGIVIGLTFYAFKTDADWTGAGPYLFAAVLCLMLFGLVCMFFPNPFMQKVYCGLGALIFSFYLVYDTQIIVGGKHSQFRLGVDEYVFGALALYLDIINLFIYILQILGNDR